MKTLRGIKIIEIGCLDQNLNIFYSELNDGRRYVMRQPRRKDRGNVRKAWREINPINMERYRRANVEETWLYNANKRCIQPLYDGSFPGVLPLIVEVDDEIVGLSDAFFRYGSDFEIYRVGSTDRCASFSIVVLDKLHGLGIGSYYAVMSDMMARHYGCKWILGYAYIKGGTLNIRQRDGWEILATDGRERAIHRKQL